MAPRAYWTGNIKISLVSFGVRMYNAVSEAEKVRLNQVHKGCNQRIKMPTTCPIHGQLDRSEIAKAYEFEKDKYIVIEQEELDKIKIRSEKTVELSKFVPIDSIEEVYLDSTYYVAPDGPVSEEPFRVFREALEKTGTAGIGKLTIAGRERPILLRPGGKGLALSTLHTATEVRDAKPYFEEIKPDPANKEYMQLATSLIQGKLGEFDPAEFRDSYQDALVELIKSKIAGQAPVIIQEEELPQTFNFAEALRQSLDTVGRPAEKKPAAGSAPAKPAAAKKKPPARSGSASETAKGKRKKQA